jgi:uncharacterized membrane protein
VTLNRWLLAAVTSLALLGVGGVAAADSTDWASLTAAQQKVLAPLSRDWGGIETPRRAKWLEVAAKFPTMPKEEQARVQARMADWARMTPAERSRARLQFQEVKQVPTTERQAKWEAYQALPDEQKQAFAQTAKRSARAASTPASAGKMQASGTALPEGKRNLVQASTPSPTRAVTPTTRQAKPGATTTTMTARPQVPAHQQAGLPKIAATPGFVDPSTLLPKRGPQGAAGRSASAPSEPAAQGQ